MKHHVLNVYLKIECDIHKIKMTRFEKIVHANFRKSDKFLEGTNIQLYMETLQVWYARFVDLDDEFADGEYLLKIKIKDNFPYEAPDINFMTPNGVYEANNTVICTGYGAHHKDTYTPAKGVHGVLGAVLGNMLDWKNVSHGIGFKKTTSKVKKQLAKSSKPFNRNTHPEIVNYFDSKYGK